MKKQVIIVTGATGFLGSAITIDLSRYFNVIALDRRKPTEMLLKAAPNVSWQQVDISDDDALAMIFKRTKHLLGRIDFVVHFAAFYHFGTDWHPEYERTNVRGTLNVLQSSIQTGVQRLIFASSIAVMEAPPLGEVLTEKTETSSYIPYARSKSLGEQMILKTSNLLPGIVLRIGGAFSDWCELPPLYSLLKLWTGPSPMNRLVVGEGTSGFPFIHRDEVIKVVRFCIEKDDMLDPYEVLLASHNGAVLHEHLFQVIHQTHRTDSTVKPIFITPSIAKIVVYLKCVLGYFTLRMPYERPWMLKYVDRPWITDITYTKRKLGWEVDDELGIIERLPTILEHLQRDPRTWEHRNRIRNKGQYAYYSAEYSF